jgi:hypothetical protein
LQVRVLVCSLIIWIDQKGEKRRFRQEFVEHFVIRPDADVLSSVPTEVTAREYAAIALDPRKRDEDEDIAHRK